MAKQKPKKTPSSSESRSQSGPQDSGRASQSNARLCAVLAYILIGIIWYFADQKMQRSDFVRFHTKQAIVLLCCSIIIHLVGSIIPFIGVIISWVGGIVMLVLWILGIVYAATQSRKELPLIGGLARYLSF